MIRAGGNGVNCADKTVGSVSKLSITMILAGALLLGVSQRAAKVLPSRGFRIKWNSVLLTVFVACASVFSLVSVMEANSGSMIYPASFFVPTHTALEMLAISVSLSIFGIRWAAGRLTKDLQSLFIGGAFLSVGLFHLFHVLSYPGLLSSSPQSSFEVSNYFYIFGRFTMIGVLLVVAFLPFRRQAKFSDSTLIIVSFVLLSLFALFAVMFHVNSLPSLYSQNNSLTWFERALEYSITFLFLVGILRYWQLGRNYEDSTYYYLTGALIVGVFEGLSFTLSGRASSLTDLMGHCFGFMSFLFVFLALLRESVIVPFQKLGLTRKMLEKEQQHILEANKMLELRAKEAEAARLKAQAYFDFLAHDVSNLISPIISYAEMLSMDQGIPPEQKHFLDSILKQGQQVAVFITNLRRLADAESVKSDEFIGIDLGEILLDTEKAIRMRCPNKKLSIIFAVPVDAPAYAVGGAHVENVLYEIMSNAVGDAPEEVVRLSITLNPIKTDGDPPFWQICITQPGHRFSPEEIEEAKVIYDPKRHLRRGIASSFSFYSSIVSHFGGRLSIENPQGADLAQGSRVIIELPMAKIMGGPIT